MEKVCMQLIGKLLNSIVILCEYVAHGTLLEYERGQPIYHDDDLDIRFDLKNTHISCGTYQFEPSSI